MSDNKEKPKVATATTVQQAVPQQQGVAILKDEMPQFAALIRLNGAGDSAEVLARQELAYLEEVGMTNPKIFQCEKLSIVLGVKWALKNNLTLDRNAGLVYIQTRNVKVGSAWKQVLEVKPSPEGLISIARQYGRILDIKNPKVTKDAHGKVIEVTLSILIPAYPKPRWEDRVFDESNFERWRKASHKNNSKSWDPQAQYPNKKGPPNDETLNYANELFTSWKGGMDPEFAKAKAVRHGLKKLGINANELKKELMDAGVLPVPAPAKKLDINPEIAKAEALEEDVAYEEVKSTPMAAVAVAPVSEPVKSQVQQPAAPTVEAPKSDEL